MKIFNLSVFTKQWGKKYLNVEGGSIGTETIIPGLTVRGYIARTISISHFGYSYNPMSLAATSDISYEVEGKFTSVLSNRHSVTQQLTYCWMMLSETT